MRYNGLSLKKRLALELDRQLQLDTIRRHPLMEIFWECTLRCDLKCRHCGSDCKTKAEAKDMPIEDFLKVLEGVKKCTDSYDVFVSISGGEPLMRPDLEECGRKIFDLGFPWGIVTNAMHLTPKRFGKLVESGMHSMAVSLDGMEEDHDWMRGKKGCFKKVEQAISLLREQPLVVYDIVTCVTERNIDTLPEMRSWLIGQGVKQWRVADVFPMGRAAGDPMMKLSDRRYRQMLDFIRETQRDYPELSVNYGCAGFVGEYEFDVRPRAFFCQAGITVAGVLADGSISSCTSIRSDYTQGNIYKDDFMDVWENRFKPYRDHSWMKTGECNDCNMWRYCRGNGMHLRDNDGRLLQCHLERIIS